MNKFLIKCYFFKIKRKKTNKQVKCIKYKQKI